MMYIFSVNQNTFHCTDLKALFCVSVENYLLCPASLCFCLALFFRLHEGWSHCLVLERNSTDGVVLNTTKICKIIIKGASDQ